MKLILGPRLRRTLRIEEKDADALIGTSKEEDIDAIRKRVCQALAATELSDMSVGNRLIAKDTTMRRYHLGLKFTWSWPVPLGFDLTIVDEQTWEIELVKDDTNRR